MAILGYDTNGANGRGLSPGRMLTSKHTLASAAVLNELWGWFGNNECQVRIVIYADSAGSPGARVAYTNILTKSTAGVVGTLGQTGFSVPLAAGDDWIGFSCLAGGTTSFTDAKYGSGGTTAGKSGGAADPPPNPFGSTDELSSAKYSCWAVIAAAAPAFVPQIVIT